VTATAAAAETQPATPRRGGEQPAPFSGATICFQGLARQFSAVALRRAAAGAWEGRHIEHSKSVILKTGSRRDGGRHGRRRFSVEGTVNLIPVLAIPVKLTWNAAARHIAVTVSNAQATPARGIAMNAVGRPHSLGCCRVRAARANRRLKPPRRDSPPSARRG
jgi:hypothetical protein